MAKDYLGKDQRKGKDDTVVKDENIKGKIISLSNKNII